MAELEAALPRFFRLARRKMNDDPEGHPGVDFTGPPYDICLCIVVEVALGEGRGIERVEDLPELPDTDLDRGVVDLIWLCGHRMRSTADLSREPCGGGGSGSRRSL